MKFYKSCALATLLVITANAPILNASDLTLEELAAFIVQHNSALQAVAAFDTPENKAMQDRELMAYGLKTKPNWSEPYGDLTIVARIFGENSVILVCNPEGTRALLEDTSCTSSFDQYRNDNPSPCELSYTAETICPITPQ